MRFWVTVRLVLPLLLLAGCTTAPQGAKLVAAADGNYHVGMTDQFTFDPVEAIVPKGATVVWDNDAGILHDVAGYKGDPIKDDTTQFSSSRDPPEGFGRQMVPGESFQHTFSEKGTWTIWCHTHHEEDMKMVLHVV